MEKIKKFFGENGYLIVKLLVVHVVISMFGLMTWLPLNKVGESVLHTVLAGAFGIISVVFYFYMIYYKVWEIGSKDNIRVVGGRAKATPAKGFIIGLITAIPDFIICALYVVFWFLKGYEWAVAPCAIFSFIATLWEGMFMGVKEVFFQKGPYLFMFIPFFTVMSCGICYILGTKDIYLAPAADTPEDEEKRRYAKENKKKLKEEKKSKRHESDDDDDELI